MARAIIPVFIPHLGCPQGCVFCNQRAIARDAAPTPQAVAAEVEAALAQAGTARGLPEIAFYGGSFTAIPQAWQTAYLDIAAELVARGRAGGIRLSTRPDCVDSRAIALLRGYPVETVELGAQSMSDRVLLAARRGHRAADTAAATARLRAAGLQVVLQMMTGLPGAGPEDDLATARALAALEPQGARIYPTCVVRDTPLEGLWRQGLYAPQTLEAATETAAACLEVFAQAGIPVLRIGLNPTEALSGGGVVAGPYHPAMGELARGRRLRHLAQARLDSLAPDARVRLWVPAGRAPLLRGQRRCNMEWLAQRYPHMEITVAEGPGQAAELEVEVL